MHSFTEDTVFWLQACVRSTKMRVQCPLWGSWAELTSQAWKTTVSTVQGRPWWAPSPQMAAGLHPLGAVSLCRSRQHPWFRNSGCHILLLFLPALQSVVTTAFSHTWGIKWSHAWCPDGSHGVLCAELSDRPWCDGGIVKSCLHLADTDRHLWRCAMAFNKAKLPRTIPIIPRWLQTQVTSQMLSHQQHFYSLRYTWQLYQALKLLDHARQKLSSPRSLAPRWVSFQGILHFFQTHTVKCNLSAPRWFF